MIDACAQIRERLSEIKGLGHPNHYGLFLHDEDPKKGVWLEPGRTLEHYLLRDNVSILYYYNTMTFLCGTDDIEFIAVVHIAVSFELKERD